MGVRAFQDKVVVSRKKTLLGPDPPYSLLQNITSTFLRLVKTSAGRQVKGVEQMHTLRWSTIEQGKAHVYLDEENKKPMTFRGPLLKSVPLKPSGAFRYREAKLPRDAALMLCF